MTEIAPRITVDATVRFGRPVIKGTRVPVETVVGQVASGLSVDDVAAEFGIERDDVLAALAYAARAVADEQVRAAE